MEVDLQIQDPGTPVATGRFVFQASPLISCLMITRGKVEVARTAIACFLAQTYGPRELIAYCQDHDSPLRQFIAGIGDPRIRFVPAPEGSLGNLRNAVLAEARGDLVCIWDDDDLHDPLRLEVMLSVMTATKASATFLQRLTAWWPAQRKLAVTEPRLWEGSMLARKAVLPPYPAFKRGEDKVMSEMLQARTRVASIDAPGLYVYRVTGQNTWDLGHFETVFARASHDLTPEYDQLTQRWRKLTGEAGLGA
jgi:glycosyltransferase involved in cell wall biosynthesis